MVKKSVGERIRYYRKRKGLTQEKLSELLDISPNYLSSLERGRFNINLNLLVNIMNCLDCTADDLFCDVMTFGYRNRASRLSDMIETLPLQEQNRIFSVVETMIQTAKKS